MPHLFFLLAVGMCSINTTSSIISSYSRSRSAAPWYFLIFRAPFVHVPHDISSHHNHTRRTSHKNILFSGLCQYLVWIYNYIMRIWNYYFLLVRVRGIIDWIWALCSILVLNLATFYSRLRSNSILVLYDSSTVTSTLYVLVRTLIL